MTRLMHAIQFDNFGTSDVLHLKEIPLPTISDDEILNTSQSRRRKSY